MSVSQVDRRTFLRAGGAVAAIALTSCSEVAPGRRWCRGDRPDSGTPVRLLRYPQVAIGGAAGGRRIV
ncbi:twin-arginine translocation signal domain-containing protein [Kribbella qitaiheensis]|uniref:twin-arginine translocation signal domain-containing protein n=1 Tax=Kribbella qitaiheensis TaxID=1544730 RepID=UPI0036153CCF